MNQILTKEFTLAEVLGVTSGYLLADGGFDRLQELMEWLVSGPVFTHQIPYVGDSCAKSLLKQFPQLGADDVAKDVASLVAAIREKNQVDEATLWRKLKEGHGSTFQVAPMQPFDEFEQPPLITPNIAGKVTIVQTPSNDSFPENIDA